MESFLECYKTTVKDTCKLFSFHFKNKEIKRRKVEQGKKTENKLSPKVLALFAFETSICSWKKEWRTTKAQSSIVITFFAWLSTTSFPIWLSDRLFSIAALDGAESVLLHKNSNKSSNTLLDKVLSAPSFSRYWKQLIGRPIALWKGRIFLATLSLATIWLKFSLLQGQ